MQRDFTVSDVALELKLTEGRVRALFTDKKLKASRTGVPWLIREKDLREFQQRDRRPGRPRKEQAG